MAWLISISIIFAILAGIAKAICDTTSFHYDVSVFTKHPMFWNPAISWKNKYKGNDPSNGAKFPGSTTIFVALTDGWHLFGLIERISLAIAFTLAGILIAKNVWFVFLAVGCYILFAFIFHMFYTYVFVKK